MKRDVHVVPRGDMWAVKVEGAGRASSLHDTQRQAIDAGRVNAQNKHVELVIHRPDGRIRDSESYGNDPCPPRDKD